MTKKEPSASYFGMGSLCPRAFSGMWLLLWALLALMATQVSAQTPDADIKAIRAVLELPDEKIDLAQAKLTIDRMIEPGTDVASTLQRLDTMAAEVKARLPTGPSAGTSSTHCEPTCIKQARGTATSLSNTT